MNFLVDTNVLSEPRQRRPRTKVIEWLKANESNLYTSVLVIGEKQVVLPIVDSLLAATARRYRLTVATDNVADFKHAGIPVFNPFG